jgi:hypothetical protein
MGNRYPEIECLSNLFAALMRRADHVSSDAQRVIVGPTFARKRGRVTKGVVIPNDVPSLATFYERSGHLQDVAHGAGAVSLTFSGAVKVRRA